MLKLSNLQDRVKGLESEKRGLESKIEAKSDELTCFTSLKGQGGIFTLGR